MGRDVTFTAELWMHGGEGGWHFVTLPTEAAEQVEDAAPPRAGFGSVRVTVTIGESTWSTSLFPDRKSASYVLPVKRAVREANDLLAGDVVTVTLVVL